MKTSHLLTLVLVMLSLAILPEKVHSKNYISKAKKKIVDNVPGTKLIKKLWKDAKGIIQPGDTCTKMWDENRVYQPKYDKWLCRFDRKLRRIQFLMSKKIQSVWDRPPLCQLKNPNTSLIPQSKIVIDWKRMEGEWFEVFRLKNNAEPKDSSCNRDGYQNSIDKKGVNFLKNAFEYTNKNGDNVKFDKNKIYASGDKHNSWWHVYFDKIPYANISGIWQKIFSPVIRRYPAHYMVLDIDENYQWILVGEPCHSLGWMLQISGSERIPEYLIKEKKELMKELGYNMAAENIVDMDYAVTTKCPTWNIRPTYNVEGIKTTAEEIETTAEKIKTTAEKMKTATEEIETNVEPIKVTAEEIKKNNQEIKTIVEEIKSTAQEIQTAAEEISLRKDSIFNNRQIINQKD